MSKPAIKFQFGSFQANTLASHKKESNMQKGYASSQNQSIPVLKSSQEIKEEQNKQKQGNNSDLIKQTLRNKTKVQQQKPNNKIDKNGSQQKIIQRHKIAQLLQLQAIVQDPVQSDFSNNKPNPSKDKKEEEKQISNHSEQQNNNQANQNKPRQVKKEQPEKKRQNGSPFQPQKKKYTFSIITSHDETEQACCNLFGLCDKQIQATYPIPK